MKRNVRKRKSVFQVDVLMPVSKWELIDSMSLFHNLACSVRIIMSPDLTYDICALTSLKEMLFDRDWFASAAGDWRRLSWMTGG